MTNAEIIFRESTRLMEEGILEATGRVMTIEVNGEEVEMQEPEEIHTYQAWKRKGYQVQQGQKAIAKFPIWKHTVKKAKDKDGTDEEKMFMVNTSFFSRKQVEALGA